MVLSIQYKDESSKFNRGRDKSRLGLRNWRKNEQYKNRIVRFFFLKFSTNLTFGRRLFASL